MFFVNAKVPCRRWPAMSTSMPSPMNVPLFPDPTRKSPLN
jgi:hypothetical protein